MPVIHTYRPKFSRGILVLYGTLFVLLIALYAGITIMIIQEGESGIPILIATFAVIIALLSFINYRAYKMRYEITEDTLVIHGVFRTHALKLRNIKEAKTSPVPFGFRLFGASFLGGFYYLPGIGFTWIAMGNFKDGVLITTQQEKHYFITPHTPLDFISHLRP